MTVSELKRILEQCEKDYEDPENTQVYTRRYSSSLLLPIKTIQVTENGVIID